MTRPGKNVLREAVKKAPISLVLSIVEEKLRNARTLENDRRRHVANLGTCVANVPPACSHASHPDSIAHSPRAITLWLATHNLDMNGQQLDRTGDFILPLIFNVSKSGVYSIFLMWFGAQACGHQQTQKQIKQHLQFLLTVKEGLWGHSWLV